MNKNVAELLAAFIPSKMARNRWRGIFRYGLIRAIKLKQQLRQSKTTQPLFYLAVCAIVKNEGAYFQEWIEWHKKMGVEKFYIYDNESDDDTKKILEPYIESGLVEYVLWKGKKQQLLAYDNCMDVHRLEAQWIAIIDLDEFIVPIKDKTIPEFLRRFENFSVVEINWLIYGSGGAQKKEDGSVMERFKYHSNYDNVSNRLVKSIVNPRRVFSLIGAHEAARISGKSSDSHGIPIKKNFRYREPQHDIIRINHYAVKSYEEFLSKRARGRVRKSKQLNSEFFDKYFERYDLNDIKDD